MGVLKPEINKPEKNRRIKELVKQLDNSKAGVRYNAFAALAGRPDISDDIKNKLKNMMYTDPDPWVKTIATLRFAELGDPAISENLIKIIKEGTQENKLQLLRIITENGVSSDVTVLQIVESGLEDKKILVRHQAIVAANATKNKQLIPKLGELLQEKHYRIRLQTAKALYNLGRDESVDYLIGLLADKNIEVHSAARTYLAAINSDSTYRHFNEDSFAQPADAAGGSEPVREKTVQGIGQELVLKGLALLHHACRDRYRGVRIEALKSITIFRHPSSIEVVEKLLSDKFPEVRIEAINTLERIGGRRSLEAIETVSRDRKKIVREAAERALARMNRSK